MQFQLINVHVPDKYSRFFDVPEYEVPVIIAAWDNPRGRRRLGVGPDETVAGVIEVKQTGVFTERELDAEWKRIRSRYGGKDEDSQVPFYQRVYADASSFRRTFEDSQASTEDLDPAVRRALQESREQRAELLAQVKTNGREYIEQVQTVIKSHSQFLEAGEGRDLLQNLAELRRRIDNPNVLPDQVVIAMQDAMSANADVMARVAFLLDDEDEDAQAEALADAEESVQALINCPHIKADWMEAFIEAGLDSPEALANATVEQIDALPVARLGERTAEKIIDHFTNLLQA